MNRDKMLVKKEDLRLYAVTDRAWLQGRSLEDVVEQSLKGGVTFLQLREKMLNEDHFFAEAKCIKELAARFGVTFVINDNVDIAKTVDADGVHVGQDDMELQRARRILGPDKVIGVSVHTVEEAVAAERNGADYLGVGAFRATSTKGDAHVVSREVFQEIGRAVSIPIVAIGGIAMENLSELKEYRVDGAALVSAIYASEDITGTCRKLRENIERIVR